MLNSNSEFVSLSAFFCIYFGISFCLAVCTTEYLTDKYTELIKTSERLYKVVGKVYYERKRIKEKICKRKEQE
jgi:hypothetical protein